MACAASAKRLHAYVVASRPARYIIPEAHDAYLHGRYLWYGGQFDKSADYFRKAIALQPDYALGWSGLTGRPPWRVFSIPGPLSLRWMSPRIRRLRSTTL